MIQVLKKTPITFNGVDGWEVLVKDDEIEWESTFVCDRCIYTKWIDLASLLVPCDIYHECLNDHQTYYIFEPK